jgi:hypothetical protein
LLTIPATVYAGMVAGGVRSRLATLGTGLGVLTSLGCYLATDVLVQIAATGGDRSAATRTYGAYLQAELIPYGGWSVKGSAAGRWYGPAPHASRALARPCGTGCAGP